MSRAEMAKNYFLNGYTCSQAVALAFADLSRTDKNLLKKLMLPFGGGVGRLRLTCGAVSGMAAVIGLLFAESDTMSEITTETATENVSEPTPENAAGNKKEIYALVQKLCGKFKEEHGSMLCGELLQGVAAQSGGEAEPRTNEYYKKRPCAELVYSAAKILEEYLALQE